MLHEVSVDHQHKRQRHEDPTKGHMRAGHAPAWPPPIVRAAKSPALTLDFGKGGGERTGLEKDFDKVLAISDSIIVGRVT